MADLYERGGRHCSKEEIYVHAFRTTSSAFVTTTMLLPDELSAPPNGQSSLWKYFHKFKGRNFKDDQSHKAAWCKGCVQRKCRDMLQEDEVAVLRGEKDHVRTDDYFFEQGALLAVLNRKFYRR